MAQSMPSRQERQLLEAIVREWLKQVPEEDAALGEMELGLGDLSGAFRCAIVGVCRKFNADLSRLVYHEPDLP